MSPIDGNGILSWRLETTSRVETCQKHSIFDYGYRVRGYHSTSYRRKISLLYACTEVLPLCPQHKLTGRAFSLGVCVGEKQKGYFHSQWFMFKILCINLEGLILISFFFFFGSVEISLIAVLVCGPISAWIGVLDWKQKKKKKKKETKMKPREHRHAKRIGW